MPILNTKNFSSEDFQCKCGCGTNMVSQKLINACQAIRDVFNLPIVVNSGTRCEKHNAQMGGVPNSYHCQGLAADLSSPELEPEEIMYVARHVKAIGGIGIYDTFCHIDVREYKDRKAYWDERVDHRA